MFWKEDYVVGSFRNICTVAIHCWYIKNAFAGFCQQIFEKKKIHILVDDCFHSNSKFLSKSSYPLQRCNTRLRYDCMLEILKGYLRYTTIFDNKVALDQWLLNFFIRRKSNVLFPRYLAFYVFVKSTNFKICDVTIGIAA